MNRQFWLVLGIVLSFLVYANSAFALDKEELKKTINEMTLDDYGEILQAIQQKEYKLAEGTGYISFPGSINIGGSGGYYLYFPSGVNQNKPAGLTLRP